MSNSTPIVFRQGDVLLIQRPTLPKSAQKQEGPCILAYGEVTGHSHQVKTDGEIWVDVNDAGRRYLKVLQDTSLDHEEHSQIALKGPSIYEVIIQGEYTPEGIRNVVD